MGGRDKALLERGGEPLWKRQLQVLRELQPDRLLLSAREDQAWLGDVPDGVQIVLDPPGVDEGPMGGIVRCLEAVQAPLMVLGIDLPQITPALLREEWLGRMAAGRGVFLRSAIGFEPLVALYHPTMLRPMRDALDAGRLSLQSVITECVDLGLALDVPATPKIAAALGNVNTPEEWENVSL